MRTVQRIHHSGSLTLLAVAAVWLLTFAATPQVAANASHTAQAPVAAVVGPSPGTYAGLGFDACTAPSNEAMQAWLASPYRAVGIYFGGVNRGCTQPNLTASWVATQQAAGWHLMPLYVGPQPFCTTSTKPVRFNQTNAFAQGRASAEDAALQAQSIGLARESILI
jgi:hypothetical protein